MGSYPILFPITMLSHHGETAANGYNPTPLVLPVSCFCLAKFISTYLTRSSLQQDSTRLPNLESWSGSRLFVSFINTPSLTLESLMNSFYTRFLASPWKTQLNYWKLKTKKQTNKGKRKKKTETKTKTKYVAGRCPGRSARSDRPA